MNTNQDYAFINSSFDDVFQDSESIYIINQDIGIETINSIIHECVTFEESCNINIPQNTFDNIVILDGVEYELRLITGITEINRIQYDAFIFSRHGGYHSKWWYQARKNSSNRTNCFNTLIQIVGDCPDLIEDATYTAVYVKCKNNSLAEISKELLRYIGGQTHIVC